MQFHRFTVLALASSAALFCAEAQAQAKGPDGQWHGSASAGITSASGNTSSNAVNLSADTARETADNKISLGAVVARASNKSGNTNVTTTDLLRLSGRYDQNLSAKLFGYAGLDLEKDGVAKLDLRTVASAGLGYKVIREKDTTFDVFAGVAHTKNDFKAPLLDSSGAAFQFGEESTHQLSATSAFKQRLVVYAGGGDVGNRATWDLGLTAALAGNLTMNAGYGLRYASKVPVGAKKIDGLFTVGAGYKY